ncbi:MAG: hypothetical protein Q7R49_02525 [Candidatus Daviesbacteria bacterium]|nr:hypothetical protein [Candidatus Daviesbacteria bacterium]
MSNKVILGSMAMDLKRVALGYWRGSKTADIFLREAQMRKSEIKSGSVKPYIENILSKIDYLGELKDKKEAAENALMYSTIIQNAAVRL